MRLRAFLIAVLSVAAIAAPPAAFGDGKDDKDGKGQKQDKDDKDGKKDGKGDKKDGDKKGEKDPRDTPEWKVCAAIGREFAAKDAAALVARIADGDKLEIKLGDKSEKYGPDQAKSVLRQWFKEKSEITLKLTSVKDAKVGIFDMTVVGAKERKWQLHVEVKARRDGGFSLVRIEKLGT